MDRTDDANRPEERDAPLIAACDWRSHRTWLVFLVHVIVAGALVSAVVLLVLAYGLLWPVSGFYPEPISFAMHGHLPLKFLSFVGLAVAIVVGVATIGSSMAEAPVPKRVVGFMAGVGDGAILVLWSGLVLSMVLTAVFLWFGSGEIDTTYSFSMWIVLLAVAEPILDGTLRERCPAGPSA